LRPMAIPNDVFWMTVAPGFVAFGLEPALCRESRVDDARQMFIKKGQKADPKQKSKLNVFRIDINI